jgi:hypothetical protein
MLIAGARRFLLVLVGVAAATAVVSLALGALADASAQRSISLGLYLAGSVLLIGGFFVGSRGPLRSVNDQGPAPVWKASRIRGATVDERRETIGASAIYITVGLALIALGIVTDSRVALF